MFVPPLNLGGFQPSPATLAQWVYQIWQYLQENPIATQEQLQEYIGTFITTSPETRAMIGEGVEQYLTENPPAAPVQSVQGKTGAVQLAYNEIVPASNAVPVYKASSTPSTNTLTGQYNLGYRLFVNTTTQEIFTISPAGALSLVGRGKFDGTTIDLDTAQGDTTISEAVTAIEASISGIQTSLNTANTAIQALESDLPKLGPEQGLSTSNFKGIGGRAQKWGRVCMLAIDTGKLNAAVSADATVGTLPAGFRPISQVQVLNTYTTAQERWLITPEGYLKPTVDVTSNTGVRFSAVYITNS